MKHPENRRVEQYISLLARYRPTLNLISEAAFSAVGTHIRDALAFASLIAERRVLPPTILDVGSGAGFPGVILGLALPEVTVVLVERRRRRGAFLNLVKAQLGLDNLEVRVEDVRSVRDKEFAVITAQAFGSLKAIYQATSHLHAPRIVILSRKGPGWLKELGELASLGLPVQVLAEERLESHGRLVMVRLPGGLPCRP